MVKPSTVKSVNLCKANFDGLSTRLASLDWNDIFNNSVCSDCFVLIIIQLKNLKKNIIGSSRYLDRYQNTIYTV